MRVINLFAVTLCLILLSGCSDGSGPATPVAPVNPESIPAVPEHGGTLVQPMLGEPSNLIPPLSSDSASFTICSQIYVSLLKYDKDINLIPYAAESYEVLNDGKLLRFKVREDIYWTDGVQLTAEDVEFTYKLMIDPKTPTAYAGNFKLVKTFRRTGKFTFEVEYDQPFANALITWAMNILPKHALENEDLLDTKYSREPLGAGPYKLKEWVTGSQITLEANESFFEGKPYIDRIVYRMIPDMGTQFLELKAGSLDTMALDPLQYLYQTSGPGWDGSFNKFKFLAFGYSFLGFNFKHPFFQDVRVRKAIDYAIDRRELVKGVLYGLGEAANGPYKPGTWQYNATIRPREFNQEKARQLLAEAGWIDSDGDGWLDKDGKSFAFSIITNQGNTQRIKTGVIIQQRLKDIGIKVELRTVEWAAFLKEFVDKGRYDALILGWNILQDPDIYNVWHSSKAVDGGLNIIKYINPELDALLERGRHMVVQEERKPVYDEIQQILYDEVPYCFLYIPMSLPIVQARVQNIKAAPAGISYNSEKWWIPRTLQRQP
ncbi:MULTISPECIES: peptide-binding protein [unclassified Pseudodesulfovibrio]|uniref:peptide-binding protein n=1 Tax=unclassified Pseudodesulfovibrio TaxID=2661612 RepID=UPI000FEB7C4D|nr:MULTISPECIES: peptide-binding protein [unclassified Pseudodesulfovibrio]MCJ2163265.1 peptide-binding protein [Pseudodesulfovibrio sp. S3-i]RWU07246.1 peptide-binding protein [Pseudodesulfovibrio sp. S3]